MATLRKITGKIILLFLIFWAILILHKWFVYCWGKKFTQPFSSSGGRKILTGLKSLKGCISCYSLATGLYRIILSTRIIHPILYRTTERKKTWMILHALCKITFKKEAERHLSLTKIFFDRCGLNEFGQILVCKERMADGWLVIWEDELAKEKEDPFTRRHVRRPFSIVASTCIATTSSVSSGTRWTYLSIIIITIVHMFAFWHTACEWVAQRRSHTQNM